MSDTLFFFLLAFCMLAVPLAVINGRSNWRYMITYFLSYLVIAAYFWLFTCVVFRAASGHWFQP